LVLSTLSGKLYGLDPLSSEIFWVVENDESSVKANTNINDYVNAVYLPDPSTGHLYKLQNGDNGNELKKLPYTIPELVQRSPCKSSEGILFSGKKSDSWLVEMILLLRLTI
jgi:serine/threonine-protein kinase/endoribonuclease IRE1